MSDRSRIMISMFGSFLGRAATKNDPNIAQHIGRWAQRE
jgi:hypothetical protein